uniref:Uncharacterized protein n=1 Tax=uncultured marine virus TaxID=186617 RepID=A0A0F7L281_9VIRU|nr:hypothetical protein [uncultured marine virus]
MNAVPGASPQNVVSAKAGRIHQHDPQQPLRLALALGIGAVNQRTAVVLAADVSQPHLLRLALPEHQIAVVYTLALKLRHVVQHGLKCDLWDCDWPSSFQNKGIAAIDEGVPVANQPPFIVKGNGVAHEEP